MKIKDFFCDFEVNPISANPLHGPVSAETTLLLQERNQEKLQRSIQQLGTKWLVHPANQVQRKETP